MKNVIAATSLVLGMVFGGFAVSQCYHIGIASAQPAPAAEGSAATPAPAPHDKIHNPAEEPKDFVGDMKTAKTKGWFAAVLVGLYGLCRALGTLGKKYKMLDKLNKGKVAMIVAGTGVVLAAAVDALFNGGTLVSVGIAAIYALIGLMSPSVPEKPSEQPS